MVINIDNDIARKLPNLILGGMLIDIEVKPSSGALLELIDRDLAQISGKHSDESIREIETVKATKDAYRVLGKDPNRYRPSAESLLRRVSKGKGIYQISNAVDILNLTSVKTGYSICGYDFKNIIGQISLGIGEEDEPYIGIGRGLLNIGDLPVFRDELSAFGTPTSDSVRTMVSEKTSQMLLIFIAFGDEGFLNKAVDEAIGLYEEFASARLVEKFIIKV